MHFLVYVKGFQGLCQHLIAWLYGQHRPSKIYFTKRVRKTLYDVRRWMRNFVQGFGVDLINIYKIHLGISTTLSKTSIRWKRKCVK
jgi:hypothetical protein